MEHRLKTVQPYFTDVRNGLKTFEVRKNDRDFKVGDVLLLEEYRDTGGAFTSGYTGLVVRKKVVYVLKDIPEHYGVKKGYCILGLEN